MMNNYEKLLEKANEMGLSVKEVQMTKYDGLIRGRKIGIRKSIKTYAQKADTLAEEIAHYRYTVGNILDQSISENRKQENIARFHAYNERIGLIGIINAYEAHFRNRFEMAEFLDVSEPFLAEALECYRKKYGVYKAVDNYLIMFEPNLAVIKLFD